MLFLRAEDAAGTESKLFTCCATRRILVKLLHVTHMVLFFAGAKRRQCGIVLWCVCCLYQYEAGVVPVPPAEGRNADLRHLVVMEHLAGAVGVAAENEPGLEPPEQLGNHPEKRVAGLEKNNQLIKVTGQCPDSAFANSSAIH